MVLEDWKGYPLWIEEYTHHDDVASNARIDDYTMAKLIDLGKKITWLNARRPCDFDRKKMVKALRMPLGFFAKMQVEMG